MPLISVIIPIYNVEQYLKQCIDSVISQSFKDIEIILVDDGSPDGCGKICDEYAQFDNRVKVIHKENGGQADARNWGIKAATGEFVVFLDSDDFWAKDCLSKFTDIICNHQECDLFIGRYLTFSKGTLIDNSKLLDKNAINGLNGLSALKNILIQDINFPAFPWVYFIKRELILQNNLFFIKGLIFEDIEWLPRLFSAASGVMYTGLPFYNYRKRSGSTTRNVTVKSVNDRFYVTKTSFAFIDNSSFDCTTKKLLKARLAKLYLETYRDSLIFSEINSQILFKESSQLYLPFLDRKILPSKWKFRLAALDIFGYPAFQFVCGLSQIFKLAKNRLTR